MFNSSSIILVIDRDTFSSATLSNEIRKLGLAKTVICLKSSSEALAYLEKQQNCGYPFPKVIFYNPHKSDMNQGEFLDTFRVKFSKHCDCKMILLEEKNDESLGHHLIEDSLIDCELRKPISSGQLLRLLEKEMKVHVPR